VSDAVLGAVLVGGASRRMGTDKASLLLAGTPLSHRVRRALFDGGVGAVVLIGGDGETGTGLDEEGVVADRWPGEGPLAGLATAVAHGAAIDGVEVVVVAACDQPDLPPPLVAELAHVLLAGPHGAAGVVVRTPDGRRHPFPSAWRTRAAGALVGLVEDGQRRADAALSVGPIIEIAAPEEVIADLDTPADVDRWNARHQGPDPEVPGHPR
jgi:molybdopterin-guanine dinucleotide biosynthesis protein A